MITKLHLGCGSIKLPGFINVDCQSRLNPDMIVDLTLFPWPWPSNSVDEIYCAHVFEHLPNTIKTMQECYRILKSQGTLKVIVPDGGSRTYLQDPTHCRPWTENTINYFLQGHPSKIYCDEGFELVSCELKDKGIYGMNWKHRVRNLLLPCPIRHLLKWIILGMFDELHFTLRKPNS